MFVLKFPNFRKLFLLSKTILQKYNKINKEVLYVMVHYVSLEDLKEFYIVIGKYRKYGDSVDKFNIMKRRTRKFFDKFHCL